MTLQISKFPCNLYDVPKNMVIRAGVLIVVASVLLWLGGLLLERIKLGLPYIGGLGIVLIVIGVFVEIKKEKDKGDTGPNTQVPPAS